MKNVMTGAINPDGHSFILAFPDKIRFYKILLANFKQFADFPIKKCKIVQYSHGGQLVACKSGRAPNAIITVLDTLILHEVYSMKIASEPTNEIWNKILNEEFELDQCVEDNIAPNPTVPRGGKYTCGPCTTPSPASTGKPTDRPSEFPSEYPSDFPSEYPSAYPTLNP